MQFRMMMMILIIEGGNNGFFVRLIIELVKETGEWVSGLQMLESRYYHSVSVMGTSGLCQTH